MIRNGASSIISLIRKFNSEHAIIDFIQEIKSDEGEKISCLTSSGYNGVELRFEKYSIRGNDRLLKTVFEKLNKKGEITEESAEGFLNRLLDYNHRN